jgi:predicted nucleotidyltransferase
MFERISSFLKQVNKWAERGADIAAIVLVGSYARGKASESSDLEQVWLLHRQI